MHAPAVRAWGKHGHHAREGVPGYANAEMRPPELTIDDLDAAAVDLHELVHDRQADSGAAHMAARCAPGVEGLEDMPAIGPRDAGAAVGDFQDQIGVIGARPDGDGAAAG